MSTSLILSDVGQYMMTVDMFPVFFLAHFLLACVIVRDDSNDLGPRFRQEHPFAMWFCSLIAGLSGVFVANFLFGDPLVDIMKENALILFLTAIWYLMNYSPFDVVYKVAKFPPVIITACVLQEFLRVRFIYMGLQQASRVYPKAYIIILLGGVIKGNGYGFIKIVERLIRGKWTPSTNEILEVTYFAKSGMYASLVFLLHHIKILTVPIELLYMAVIAVFVAFRLIIVLGGVKDPLQPVELPVCALLFGTTGSEESTEKKPNTQEEKQKNGKQRKNDKQKEGDKKKD